MTRLSSALAVAAAALLLGACSDSATGVSPGTSLLQVVPQGGATEVAPDASLVITFSGMMGPGMEQYVDLHQGPVSGSVMPMTCSWSDDRAVLTCNPNEPLQNQTEYTMHLGTGMRDVDGRLVTMEQPGMSMGGQMVSAGMMMGGSHAGQSIDGMGPRWRDSDGHLGMAFSFTTH
jgi:hypothetical protein